RGRRRSATPRRPRRLAPHLALARLVRRAGGPHPERRTPRASIIPARRLEQTRSIVHLAGAVAVLRPKGRTPHVGRQARREHFELTITREKNQLLGKLGDLPPFEMFPTSERPPPASHQRARDASAFRTSRAPSFIACSGAPIFERSPTATTTSLSGTRYFS